MPPRAASQQVADPASVAPGMSRGPPSRMPPMAAKGSWSGAMGAAAAEGAVGGGGGGCEKGGDLGVFGGVGDGRRGSD